MLTGRRRALVAIVVAVLAVLAGLALAACGKNNKRASTTVGIQPSSVESATGAAPARVHLSALAAKRLDIRTATAQDTLVGPPPSAAASPAAPATTTVTVPGAAAPAAAGETPAAKAANRSTAPSAPAPTTPPTTMPAKMLRRVIPFSAVLYLPSGDAFAYTNPEPLVYVRVALKIDYIIDDLAVLASGPPAGTAVVTVGGTELYGVETGVGGA